MRLGDLSFYRGSAMNAPLTASKINQKTALAKIAQAESLVERYDGGHEDWDRRRDGNLALIDQETREMIRVNTNKQGNREYEFHRTEHDQGLFLGKRHTTREKIEVNREGQVTVKIAQGYASTGGLLTGPLVDERLPTFGPESEFLFSDNSISRSR